MFEARITVGSFHEALLELSPGEMGAANDIDVSKASPRDCQQAAAGFDSAGALCPLRRSLMMDQVMLDGSAMFDHLVADAAGWPERHADSDWRAD